MIIKEALSYGRDRLKDNSNSLNESRYLLSFLIDKDISYIHSHIDERLDEDILKKYREMVEKRSSGVPLQYITNRAYFYNREFYVDQRVLIPRFDTEILLEKTLEFAREVKSPQLLEIGSGSGIIAITLALEMEDSTVESVDISQDALDVANINKEKYNVKNLNFIKSNLYEKLDKKYDIIVSNPPYIDKRDMEKLDRQVKNEPELALYGGEDGLDFYRLIIQDACKYLKDKAYICLEIGYNQYDQVYNILKENNFKNIGYCKDLQDYKRVIYGKFKNTRRIEIV